MKRDYFIEQIRANLVAIISLITALSGVSYDTWRDHRNEENQNIRNAAFEVLKNLGELQTVVNYAHFASNQERGNPIEGWKYVLLVRDLSHLLPKHNMQQSEQLYTIWEQSWERLATDKESEAAVSAEISAVRSATLQSIAALE